MSAVTKIQFRRGTAAEWTAANPVLADGELGWEKDTGEFKFGNGTTTWNSLPYWISDAIAHTHTASEISDSTSIGRAVLSAASTAAARTAIGAGTSSLAIGTTGTTAMAGNKTFSFSEITGTLGTAQLPALAINDVWPVASQAAMLALTAQRGDMAIRSDTNKSYILSTDAPTVLADWLEIAAPGDVISVAGKTGVVTLVKADVGLSNVDNTSDASKPVSSATQTALNAKANSASPAFTGTPTGITKSHVGLSNVDNTSDASKPVSTATQTALNGKAASSHTHASADIPIIDGGTP
ncbi:minor tail protein [Arthrobacter phage Ingrid]|nr:minor tail protein [Arthrobacter phage Ingrid]QFG11002.1 minor tail protein [Arthrobacter phage Loretta]